MSKRPIPYGLVLAACLLATGCMETVSRNMGDHYIFARSAPSSHASVQGNDIMTVVTLGQKSITIMPGQVVWHSGRSVVLPDKWKKLEVAEVYTNLVVIVDGQVLHEPAKSSGF